MSPGNTETPTALSTRQKMTSGEVRSDQGNSYVLPGTAEGISVTGMDSCRPCSSYLFSHSPPEKHEPLSSSGTDWRRPGADSCLPPHQWRPNYAVAYRCSSNLLEFAR